MVTDAEVNPTQPLPTTVFYSWQSSAFDKHQRHFIQDALEKATAALRSDVTMLARPEVDRDTQGVAGARRIDEVIFAKIDAAAAFVADVSFINAAAPEERLVPNPNVLIEVGYALRHVDEDNLILVLNTATGQPDHLPFDLRGRRVLCYHLTSEATDRAAIRRELVSDLTKALRLIFTTLEEKTGPPPLSLVDQVRAAVQSDQSGRARLVSSYMKSLADDLVVMEPTFQGHPQEEWVEMLVQALDKTIPLVRDFATVAATISARNDSEAARALFKGFSYLLQLATFRPNIPGYSTDADYDFIKFLSHELITTFVACCIRDDCWDVLTHALGESIYLQYLQQGGSTMESFVALNRPVRLFQHRKWAGSPAVKGVSLHADLLSERHSHSDLADVAPLPSFVDADYFLFLRAQTSVSTDPGDIVWMPWSALHMQQAPRFLFEAQHPRYAEAVARALNVRQTLDIKRCLVVCGSLLTRHWATAQWRDPMKSFDASSIPG